MLLLNFFRDIRHTLPRLISVMIVTALGVMIYIGMSGINANMQYAIDTYLEPAAVSDLWITADDADMRDVRGLRALSSIEYVSPRVTLMTNWIEDDETNLTLHTYDGAFEQCVPYIESGRMPQSPRECMLAASFAKARGLSAGERLELEFEGRILRFTIAALVISPEYIYNVSGMDLIPNPYRNGFVYVPEEAVSTAYGTHVYNEILIKGREGVSREALINACKSVLGERCLAVLNFEDNVRAYMIYSEMQGLVSMTTTLPALFFLTAALIMFTTMQRVVENSRTMIGTLKALGYSDSRILIYFLSYAFLVIVIGTALGAVPGRAITGFLVTIIYQYFELPPIEFLMDWAALINAVSIAAACCVGAVLLTAVREVQPGPAQCMRPKPPRRSRRNIIERSPLWRVLGFSVKTVVRNIFRNRMRAIMCIVGVSLCMALIVTAIGMSDTVDKLMDDLYEKLYRYDLQVSLERMASNREERHIARLAGIERLESEMALPIEAIASGKKSDTTVHVCEDIVTLMVVDQTADVSMTMPDGLFVAKQLADDLGLSRGSALTIRRIGARKTHTLPVMGIAPNINGVYIGRSLWRSLGEGFRPSMLYLLANDPDTMKRTLEDYDFVSAVKLKQEVVSAFDAQMETMNAVVGIMILFGGVLAYVVLYSLGVMNFYDRIRDLATLSVLGFYPKEIKRLILSENMVFTILGIGLGALLGFPLLSNILTGTSMGELTFEPMVLPITYALSAGLTLVYAIIVNLLLGRKTKKIDMLGALKSVE